MRIGNMIQEERTYLKFLLIPRKLYNGNWAWLQRVWCMEITKRQEKETPRAASIVTSRSYHQSYYHHPKAVTLAKYNLPTTKEKQTMECNQEVMKEMQARLDTARGLFIDDSAAIRELINVVQFLLDNVELREPLLYDEDGHMIPHRLR